MGKTLSSSPAWLKASWISWKNSGLGRCDRSHRLAQAVECQGRHGNKRLIALAVLSSHSWRPLASSNRITVLSFTWLRGLALLAPDPLGNSVSQCGPGFAARSAARPGPSRGAVVPRLCVAEPNSPAILLRRQVVHERRRRESNACTGLCSSCLAPSVIMPTICIIRALLSLAAAYRTSSVGEILGDAGVPASSAGVWCRVLLPVAVCSPCLPGGEVQCAQSQPRTAGRPRHVAPGQPASPPVRTGLRPR
jgi:hypothetical protein